MSHSEAEIIRALETEKRMMERQQLLKELWKLSRLEESDLPGNPDRSADEKPAVVEEKGEPVGNAVLSVSGQAI
jgi:hypothetical protein